MPIYCFKCKDCDISSEVVRPMSQASYPEVCPECEEFMVKDYATQNISSGIIEYAKPLVSDSLAISKDQIAEHRQLFPDVKVTSEGQPVFTNSKQHNDYLKANGFVKLPKKNKRIGKAIKKSKVSDPK